MEGGGGAGGSPFKFSKKINLQKYVQNRSLREYHNCNYTVKPVSSGLSKMDKTKVLKTNGSLMKSKVLKNASREHSAILLTCIKR